MDLFETELEPCPELKANPISRLFMLWLWPLFQKGVKKNLDIGDLYENIQENSSSTLGTVVQTEWNKEKKRASLQTRPAKLWRVIRNLIWKKFTLVGIFYCFDEVILRTVQPILLKNFIATFSEDIKHEDLFQRQVLYAGALVLVTFCHAVLFQKLIGTIILMGIRLRLGVSSLVYRKILKLRKADSEHTNVGKLINLLSSDVSRLDQSFHLLHFFWISPIQLIVCSYLLWNELGVASFGGIGCVIVILPIQVLVGRFSMYFRTRIAKRTDERGRFLNEIIGGVRLIKMYAWEKPFGSVVSKLRRSEIKFIRRHLYLRGMYVSVHGITIKLMPFCALILYVAMGNVLKAEKVFFSIAVFNTLMQAIMNRIPTAASQLGELLASLNRVENFMLSKDNSQPNDDHYLENIRQQNDTMKDQPNVKAVEPKIIMENYSASWTEKQNTLNNLNVNLKGNKLVMVVGHVGSGKSSFLNAILSELPMSTGVCHVQGRITYASQEAWIFPASVRQNICFGLDMDKERYWKIIKLCCLSDDLNQFPDGDFSLVGERGVALSGGQKARVNMARALYQDADIYLFDDPLSAVDAKVSKALFNECIKEHLSSKLRILVTHQLQYLPLADHIIVLNRDGSIWCQGTYDELKNNDIDFSSLIDKEYFCENDTAIPADNIGLRLRRRRESSKSDDGKGDSNKGESNGLLTGASVLKRQEEQKSTGSIGPGMYYQYFKSGGSCLVMTFLVIGFLFTQFVYNFVDYWISLWTNSVTDKEKVRALRDFGNGSEIYSNSSESFVRSSEESESSQQNFYAYVYSGLMGVFIVVTIFRSILFFRYCMKISVNLHDNMFASIVRTDVKFFDDNPSGRIMNRFTKDLNHIDEHLPLAFFDFVSTLLALLGVLTLNMVANYYTVIPSLVLIFSLFKLRGVYLSTARDLKRIESVAKSPMFTHVTMTVQGLTTIRALKADTRVLDQFEKIQDMHTSVFYLMFSTNRWFAIWLEMMSITYLAFVSFGFLLLTTSSQSGNVGVAISSILSLAGGLQWGIRQSAETENFMTSVERAFEYCNLKSEAPLENPDDKKIQQDWPNEGRIRFQDVSLAYDEDNKVLKGITFSTESKEKVGIVGRTGAGKSSLLAALFRLTEPDGGIYIDDISIKDIGLHTLRSKISIIPQDPVLFSSSLRYNLDPFNEFSDDQLWKVIQEVDLHHAVQSLDYHVADGGANFSTGQRQLVCLARAILRKNRIIVLDEATANVDPATDHLVQHTIRTKFADCTILTIAHRLQSVLDSDRIMVLEVGKIVEFDNPTTLLKNQNSVFSKMLQQYNQANRTTTIEK